LVKTLIVLNDAENAVSKRNPSARVADSWAHNEIVRRGSTVRVRKRASLHPC